MTTTLRQHMQQAHEAASQQHSQLSGHCADLAECFSGMSKAAAKEDAGMYQKIASHFGAMAKIHGDASDTNAGFASDCEKATQDRLGKIVPDGVVGTIPSDVPAGGFGMSARPRAVPRYGSPEIAKAAELVPPQFKHLVLTADEV